MIISNVISDSFQEYEGEHSLVLFSKGCNLNCYHCYNRKSVLSNEIGLAKDVINKYITPMHTAVVLLGGEPLINDDIIDICRYIKDIRVENKLKIKIFTNGILDSKVKLITETNLVDAWSIDIKEIQGVNDIIGSNMSDSEYLSSINASINDISLTNATIELRTTIFDITKSKENIKSYIQDNFKDIKHTFQKDFLETNKHLI